MIRTLALIATVAALAVPAQAAEVKINIVGKDMVSLTAEIDAAAKKVCREELRASAMHLGYGSCIELLTKDAMAQVAAARADFGVASTRLDVTQVSGSR